MDYEIELNKANRLKIAQAFRGNKRVDFSIEGPSATLPATPAAQRRAT